MNTLLDDRVSLIETPQFRTLFHQELEHFMPDRVLPTIRNPEFLTYIAQVILEDSERFLVSASQGRKNSWEL